MIVEDNIELSRIYEKLLTKKGFRILANLENGRDAVEFYEETHEFPKLIIMDHRMPYKDGLTASKEILQCNSDQLILMVSADDQIQSQVANIDNIHFIRKPYSLAEFTERVNALLDVLN